MIVPFLSDVEEVVASSEDTVAAPQGSLPSVEDTPVVQALGPNHTIQPMPTEEFQPTSWSTVSSSVPRVAQAAKTNSISDPSEYKLIMVSKDPNVLALQPQPRQQWYVSTGPVSKNSPSTNTACEVVSSQGVYHIAPLKRNVNQIKVLQRSPKKSGGTVPVLQPSLPKPAQVLSQSVPVVVIGRGKGSPDVLQPTGPSCKLTKLVPSSGNKGTGPPLNPAVLSAEKFVMQSNDDASMPIITSVMSLANIDFNSIDDNAKMVVKNRHLVATADVPKQGSVLARNPVLFSKRPSTTAARNGRSVLISKSVSATESVTNRPVSTSKVVPRILSKSKSATSQPQQCNSQIRSTPLCDPLSSVRTRDSLLTMTSNNKTSTMSKVDCDLVTAAQSSQGTKPGVFELDAVKKIGNTIMGSTITFKPSMEQRSPKESGDEMMKQKLQQAISCFEESALKSSNTFNAEERNMLESMLSKIKGDPCKITEKKDPAVTMVPEKAPWDKLPKTDQEERPDAVQNSTSCKKPMRRIVITSDTLPSVAAHVIKEGIELFLQRNNISNNFTQDEILTLHWDGKDINTLHHREEPLVTLPAVDPVNVDKRKVVPARGADHKVEAPPQLTSPSSDKAVKLEFKPRVICFAKNGEVVERILSNNFPSLPVLTSGPSTLLPTQSAPTVNQALKASHLHSYGSMQYANILPATSQPLSKEPVLRSLQTIIPKQTVQKPLSIVTNKRLGYQHKLCEKTGEIEQKQFVTAIFPDGQIRRIAISTIQPISPADKLVTANVNEEPKAGTSRVPSERIQTREEKEALADPSEVCDIQSILEPEVLLEESNFALNYCASDTTASLSELESDSSFKCDTDSEESDEEDLGQRSSYSPDTDSEESDEEDLGRRSSSEDRTERSCPPATMHQPQKELSQLKRKRKPPDPYKKRRRYAALKRCRKAKVEDSTGSQVEPIAARLRYANARATVVVNCTNCIASPCIVVMDRLDDDVVKTGRVNLQEYKEAELFALSATPNVTLSQSRVVEAVKLQSADKAPEVPDSTPQGSEYSEVTQLLLDSRKHLEELRKRYQ